MSRALVLLIEAQAFLPDGTDAPLIRLVSGGSRADHFGEQWYPALTQLPLMGARLGFDGRSFQAPVTSTTGNFAFSLHMGDLERAADHIWNGADIKIYQGFDGDGDGDFNLLWHGRAASSQATEEAISVTLADPAQDLNKPILSERFQGTGGIEGGEDLKGRLKPKAWGFCENVPGILVDPANLVYRFIDGPSTILQVKDGGVPFNAGTDYPDYASLAAASVPDGAVAFCSSLSLVKVWRAPRFALTADLTASGPMRIGDIAQNLVNGASSVTFAPNTLSNFNALQPGLASAYVDDERTIAQELDRLFGGVGAWWMPNSQGEIRIGQVGFDTVVLDVKGSVESVTRNRSLPPTYGRVLGYRPNYKPLSDGEIAGAVAAGDIDDLGALATQSTINWENQVTGRPLSFRVVARGYDATSHPANSGLWDDAGTLLAGPARSYRVNVLDRATRNWESHVAYDVYLSANNAQAMADALNALGSDKIVVIFSYDQPITNRLTNGLPDAMKRCGASRTIFESANFKSRSAYILIGIPGLGEGNGVELYAGDFDSDPDAWIETNFIVDNLGNLQLSSTNVRDAVDISYSDGTVVNDVQPEEAGANVTGTNVSAGFAGQGALATLSNIPQAIADDSNLLQYAGGGAFTGDLNAEVNLAASNALNKGWMTDDLKHWYGNQENSAPVSSQYTIVDTPDGIVSDTAIRGVDNNNSSENLFSEFIPIDPARNYQATLWARQPSGDRLNYILIAFSRADKSHIAGNESNATGWSYKSVYHYQFIANNPFPETWTKYQFTFGPQGEASIPNAPGDEAVFAQIGILGLRDGTTETTIEIQGLRLDEIADATQLINGPAEAGAQVNAPNTLALVVNKGLDGNPQNGEGYLCGITNGQVDSSKAGFIFWNGDIVTVTRKTGDVWGFATNEAYRRGFLAFDTANTQPFTVNGIVTNLAFVYKVGSSWKYDANTGPVSFTPTQDMVALAWLQTGASDTIIGSGLIAPTSLDTAALPGADVTEDTPWARVGAQPSIVPNGDFEQDLAGWQIIVGTDLDPANTKVIDDAVEGKVLSMPNSGGDRALGSLTFRVFPGQTYRAVIRARHLGTNTLEDGAYFRLHLKGQYAPVITGTNRDQYYDFINGNSGFIKNTWDTYEFDYTIPAGMNYANLTFYNWSQSSVDFEIERMEFMPLGGASEWGANVTGNNIASGISGQGSLATASSVDWSSDVTGPRPIDQAYDEMSYANSSEFYTNWYKAPATGLPNSEITSIADINVPGGKAVRFGNNSGEDEIWTYLTKARMPYDPNSLYEVGIIARKVSGSGVLFCGVNGRAANGTHVNVSGADTGSSQHYFAASGVNLSSSWTTYRGYFKGQSTSGNGMSHNSPADPGTVHSNAVYVEPMFIANYSNMSGITDVAAVWLRKLSPAEFIDSRNARQSLVGGQSNAITTPYISAFDAGSTATINITSHTRRYDFGDLTYNAGSISGRSFSTRYYVYAEDGGFTGGSVTYQASTMHADSIGVNRIYLGSIVTPANGSTGGGGGGYPDDCLAAHMLLSNGKYARDLEVGDMIDVMDDDMNHVGERPVLALRHAKQNCVELVTKSARVVVSTTAPVVTKERGTLYAPQVKGLTVAVRIKGSFGFEQVLDVRPVGEKPIVRINVGGISFSAGQEADRMIYTHNIYFKP